MFLDNVNIRDIARESGIPEHYCFDFLTVMGRIAPGSRVNASAFGIEVVFPTTPQRQLTRYDVRLKKGSSGLLCVEIRGRQGPPLTLLDSILEPTVIDRLNPNVVSLGGLPRAIRRVQNARV